jgi:hypothetical protein
VTDDARRTLRWWQVAGLALLALAWFLVYGWRDA